MLNLLTKLTSLKLYGITAIYQFKLFLRVGSSVLYTYGLVYSFVDENNDIETINWVFCSLTLLSVLLTLVAGLVFISFAYIMNVAQVKKSLFEVGLIVEEEPLYPDRKSVFD